MLGYLYLMWCIADAHGDFMPGVTPQALSRLLGLDGFAESLPGEWLQVRPDGLRFPDYEKHNGSTAKRRAVEAARKADVRKVSATDADKKRAPLLLSTSDSAVEDKSHELPRAREVEHVPHFAATFLPHFPPVSSKGIGTAEAEREWASWTAEQRTKSIEAVKLYRAWWERIPPSRTKQAQEKPLKWLENFKARGFEPDDSWAKVPESSGVVTQGYRRADDTYQ